MRIVRHIDYVKNQKRRSIIMAAAGGLLLASSLFVASRPSLVLVAYVPMVLGFILFNLGMQGVGKFMREKRNDELIDHQLRFLNDRYTTIHYANLGKRVIEHMVVHPGGIAVLNAKEVDGPVSQRQQSWRRGGGFFTRLFKFSGPQLGNPSMELDRDTAALEDYLAEHQQEVDVRGAAVFLHPKVQLDIQSPDYPVLMHDEIATFIHDQRPDPSFTDDERAQLVALLGEGGEQVETERKAATSRRPRPKVRASQTTRSKPTQATRSASAQAAPEKKTSRFSIRPSKSR